MRGRSGRVAVARGPSSRAALSHPNAAEPPGPHRSGALVPICTARACLGAVRSCPFAPPSMHRTGALVRISSDRPLSAGPSPTYTY